MQFTECANKKKTISIAQIKGAIIGQLKQKAEKGPLGLRVKQPSILFENSAVWNMIIFGAL